MMRDEKKPTIELSSVKLLGASLGALTFSAGLYSFADAARIAKKHQIQKPEDINDLWRMLDQAAYIYRELLEAEVQKTPSKTKKREFDWLYNNSKGLSERLTQLENQQETRQLLLQAENLRATQAAANASNAMGSPINHLSLQRLVDDLNRLSTSVDIAR
ncbi:MAG: hypothetical protein AAF709_23520, partial [Pseudomonadota bacterium]